VTTPGWYLRRLSRMGPAEIAGRAGDAVRKRRWRRRPGTQASWLPRRRFGSALDGGALGAVRPDAVDRLVATAEKLMDGHAEYFGVTRDDLVDPDWSLDPRTGRRAPSAAYAFDIPYRDEGAVGDIKQIWEPSRHQHLTVLAAAYALTGDDRYANRVADHLKSWWAANPPLRGVHWVSGIELGIRLISWVWVRRLLDRWPGAPGVFEDNPEALHQIWHHQRWLAAFASRGSSANNHVIAEAAGQLAAACAFAWFPESARWRAAAMRSLDEHLRRNTFPSGVNRERATEYHGLVLELGLTAVAEADAAGADVPESTRLVLLRMTDALAAMVDGRLRPPRQGDADDGHGLVVDGAGTDRWASLLATGEALFGRLDWWPDPAHAATGSDVRTPLLAALTRRVTPTGARPARRPAHFADTGMTILRAVLPAACAGESTSAVLPAASAGESTSAVLPAASAGRSTSAGEIWCRCDGGPHGFLSIAAHAHADALSLEVRHDGVDVLADPGTYCYHGQPEWRRYFRSTLGHNTLRLDDKDQSVSGGPFLWTRHARSRVLLADTPDGGVARWCAEHDGYAPAVHRRSVELDGARGELRVSDQVRDPGRHACQLAFHLGPRIGAELVANRATLTWTHEGRQRSALLELPAELSWRAHRGETDPPLGWYSAGFGRREPATTLLGSGRAGGDDVLTTVLRFRG
jgi:hypothetical protein